MKPGILLDANVLIALAWSNHEDHDKVQRWLQISRGAGWATCPLTELAFVRILSNPAFSSDSLTPWQAAELLGANLKQPDHRFWNDEVDLSHVFSLFGSRIVGHRQITDAYLIALAIHKKSKLVTLDEGLRDLLPDSSSRRDFLIFL